MAPISDHEASLQLAQILKHAPIRFYLALTSNPKFAQGLYEVTSKDWRNLFYGEFGLFLLIGFLRHWRLSKTTLWYRHSWTRLWTWTLFWLLALTVVPLAVYGESYVLVLHGFAETAWAFIKQQ